MTHISRTTQHSGQINQGIIFFGTEEFSAASLHALIAAGYPVLAVVTKPDSIQGRGQTLVPPTVKKIAEAHDIPVWQPNKVSEIIDFVKALQPVAGVLVSYGKIVPQSVIDLFTPGIINVHPSKLPIYRGPSPIESAILNGDNETGVSIMQLSAAMDAGPVYTFAPYKLTGKETQINLYDALSSFGAETLMAALPSILDGSLAPVPQNEAAVTYCQLIKKSAGTINWDKPAMQIEREIRAYNNWPRSRTTVGGKDVIITQASVISPDHKKAPGTLEITEEPHGVIVHTGEDAISIERIKPADKKEMPIQAFLTGYKDRL